MALSSWLRSLSNRFGFFLKPVPLASTVGVLLLGIFIWEYSSHPEWFDGYSQEETTPDSSIDLSGLTPEEQAAIADIDNLTVLFNELGIESGGIPNIQALSEAQEGDRNALLEDVLPLAQPTEGEAATSNPSPFAEYLEQYQFSSGTRNQNLPDSATSSFAQGSRFPSPAGVARSGQRQMSNAQFANPLATALQNQNLRTDSSQSGEDANPQENPRSSNATDAPESAQSTSGSSEASSDYRSNYLGEFGSQAVTIPGVDFPVLPTLPQMSPPPGTTGYTPPATLELMPPLPGGTPPIPGTSSLAPSSAGVPDLSGTSSTPNLAAPQVDVSNGYVTPFTPTAPPTMTPIVPPAPFSAPRPPGSFLGNGYINTFSNPSAPPN